MSHSLRDLPLPVKVVVSVFLMAVGLGYTSAMVQLHVKDSKSGKPMPTVEDVIRKYTGKAKYDPNAPPPVSRFVKLVGAPRDAKWGANSSMVPAFFEKDNTWDEVTANPADLPRITAEREGERLVAELWGRTEAKEREKAYTGNEFKLAADKAPKDITPKFKNADGSFKVKDLITVRCARCHKKGGSYADAPLSSYEEIDKHLKAPEAKKPKPGSDYVDVETPISIESLTQSTHAHLLSFAVLFSLTGLVFAFSSYPVWLRCILGPWVVIAVTADVSLWWLARMCDEWGPYFAMGIIATGGAAGLGLAGQITLSLFNLYGVKGKIVIGLLFVLGGVIAGLVWVNKIAPSLSGEKPATEEKREEQKKPPEKNEPKSPKDLTEAIEYLKTADATKKQLAQQFLDKAHGESKRKEIEQAVAELASDKKEVRDAAQKKLDDILKGTPVVPVVEVGQLERMLIHPLKFLDVYTLPMELMPFEGGEEGNMVRAFFDKEKTFRNRMNDPGVSEAEKDKLKAEREGELRALIAWIRTAEAARRTAYEGKDGFTLPPDLAGKPITPDYLKDGKVQIKAMIDDRCVKCHGPGAKQADYPLTNYEEIRKYLNPPGK